MTDAARPRMGRDARRAQVLRIAQELFASEGYHHVSMDDIADRALVSKPVLYRHFPSKLDLYLAIVDQRGRDLLGAVEAAVTPIERGPVQPDDGRAVVAAVVRAYFTFVQSAGASATLLFESDVIHDEDVRSRVERAGSEASRRLAVVLADVSGLPTSTTDMLATALAALGQAAATHRFRHDDGPGDALDVETAAELVAELAWRGVAGLVRPDFEYGAST